MVAYEDSTRLCQPFLPHGNRGRNMAFDVHMPNVGLQS